MLKTIIFFFALLFSILIPALQLILENTKTSNKFDNIIFIITIVITCILWSYLYYLT